MGKNLDITELFGIDYSDAEINEMSPIRLAYIGDAVYELFVRYYIAKEPLKAHLFLKKEYTRLLDLVKLCLED